MKKILSSLEASKDVTMVASSNLSVAGRSDISVSGSRELLPSLAGDIVLGEGKNLLLRSSPVPVLFGVDELSLEPQKNLFINENLNNLMNIIFNGLEGLCFYKDKKRLWNARKVYSILGYSKWFNFSRTLKKAMLITEKNNISAFTNFILLKERIAFTDKHSRLSDNYYLTDYAFNLISLLSNQSNAGVFFVNLFLNFNKFADLFQGRNLADEYVLEVIKIYLQNKKDSLFAKIDITDMELVDFLCNVDGGKKANAKKSLKFIEKELSSISKNISKISVASSEHGIENQLNNIMRTMKNVKDLLDKNGKNTKLSKSLKSGEGEIRYHNVFDIEKGLKNMKY